MDVEQRKEVNLKMKTEFKEECNKVNAWIFETSWSWRITEKIGQIVIYDAVGKIIALWEETYARIKELQDQWGFYKDKWLVIAVNRRNIIETYRGVFALGWVDENKLFRGIFFRDEDSLYEDASELGIPSEQGTLDELRELEELDVPEIAGDIEIDEFDIME